MRNLLYVPIIHTAEDIGSLSKALTERGISRLGATAWSEHVATVQRFWDSIADYCASLPAEGMKIYQDGLLADGEIGAKIVAAGVQSGSRNYKIVEMLRQRGAEIVRTEDVKLVLEERDRLLAALGARTFAAKVIAHIKYRLVQRRLLDRRDRFIARRIVETLGVDAPGILFVGAYHRVRDKLPADIAVVEVKETRKVRQYQKLLATASWRQGKLGLLAGYLAQTIPASMARVNV